MRNYDPELAVTRLPAVRKNDDVTGLEVRRRMLEEAEVVAGRVVEAVGGQLLGRHLAVCPATWIVAVLELVGEVRV